jgi:TatD DNase family protein
MAGYCAERGWFMSFAGVITFKNADSLRAALQVVPDDLVLVETDSPYLTPVPYRGKANGSYLMPLTVRRMAEVRGVAEAELAACLWDNTQRVFGAW